MGVFDIGCLGVLERTTDVPDEDSKESPTKRLKGGFIQALDGRLLIDEPGYLILPADYVQ
jgi:hypothetical protein